MACEQTAITPEGTIPTLGCCAGGPTIARFDHVLVRLDTDFDEFSPNPNVANLQQVLTRCLAEPMPVPADPTGSFNLNIWKPARAAEIIIGGQINLLTDACYPFHSAFTLMRHRPVHGWIFQQAGSFMTYYATKIRIRLLTTSGLPVSRRWCLTECDYLTPTGSCPAVSGCDPTVGNATSTVLPAASEMEALPDPLNRIGPPPFRFREFSFKILEFDTDPPSSPFCGLP